jgi:hypothetical protein
VRGSSIAGGGSNQRSHLRAAYLERARRAVARIPAPLVVVVALGLILRIAVWAAVSPTETNLVDAGAYVRMADHELFTDPVRPAGYSLFLRAVHAISAEIGWAMLVQNALGIATACLLYAAVRRIAAPIWAAAAGAAAVLLSIDQAYLEHSFLAETLFTFLIAATLYLSIRALEKPGWSRGWLDTRRLCLLGAGACLGLSAWTRNAGAALIPFLALWVAISIPGAWWRRLGRAALAGGAAAALLLTYFALNEAATGSFGLTQVSGRVLYGRVAPFADCSQFTPPAGTEVLCEQTPPDQRYGPDYYMWTPGSVAVDRFGLDPADDAKLGEFARAAIAAQPGDYAEAVGADILRNFIPGYNDERPYGGFTYDFMRVDHPDENKDSTYAAITSYFSDEPYVQRGFASTVGDLQGVLRVVPLLMLASVLLGGAGLWLAPSARTRAVLALLLGAGLLLLAIPCVTITYNARYAVPAGGPIVAAGALGLWLLIDRLRRGSPA